MAAPEVLVGGVAQSGVQQPSIRVRHAIAKTSTASFTLRGRVDAIPVPAFGDSVEISDGSGEAVFSGFVRSANADLSDSGEFFEGLTVQCQGDNDNLRYRILSGAEGVDIVEAAHGEDQFNQIVALLAGYTGSTDLDSASVAIRTDIRYQPAAAVLRALAVANDAILHVTTGLEIRLFQRDNLSASGLARLGPLDLFRVGLIRDPRNVRSRQLLRYGAAVARRTITGDGATREFLVAGVQVAVDYMADGVAARALNAQAGDQGLRMRADATAAARTGGGIDFFGGNAGDPGSGLYVGANLIDTAAISLRMLTDGKLQLRSGVAMAAAARYGIALRHDGPGMPLWTSDGIAPTVEAEGGAPVLDSDADFEHQGLSTSIAVGGYARHGDTIFAFVPAAADEQIYGYRISGAVTVRDSRFDITATGSNFSKQLFVLGDRLHLLNRSGQNITSMAFRINAGSLTRLSAEDWNFASPTTLTATARQFLFANTQQTNVWLVEQPFLGSRFSGFELTCYGYTVSGGSLVRSSADDFAYDDDANIEFSSRRECWQDGDRVYFLNNRNTGNTRLWWMEFPSGTFDSLDMGFRRTQNDGLMGFGGRIFVARSTDIASALPGGASTLFAAVRVSQDFLEWDAPTADYNTLNTRRQADSGFRVAVMDPDILGVLVPAAEFVPIPVDVRSVAQVTLNGTQEDLGDGETWRFDVARQKLIQDPGATVMTSADSLVVEYAARAIAQACDPTAAVLRDDFAEPTGSEGLTHTEALAAAEAFLDRYGTLTDRLSISIRNNPELAHEAETVQFNTAMLRELGLIDAANADRWLIYDVQYRWDGDVLLQRAECLRGRFREWAVDWWRDREGDA